MQKKETKMTPLEKRSYSIRMYFRVNLIVLAIVAVLYVLYQEAGIRFMYGPMIAVTIVLSLGILALFPMVIYWVNLTIKARHEGEDEAVDIHTKAVAHDRISYGPWVADLVLIAIFPMLGLWFAIKKLYDEKENFLDNAFMVKAIGVGIILFSAFFLVFNLSIGMPVGFASLGAVALVAGIACVYIAGLFERQGRLVCKCRKMIYIDHTLSLDVIASLMGMPYAKVIQIYQRMIDEELFPSCYIDFRSKQIVAPVDLPKKSCKCPICGGTSIYILGYPVFCDHCGRRLK